MTRPVAPAWLTTLRREDGQSTVELVALLPLVAAVALGVGQLLAAGIGHELAAHAAENGAIALGDGEDPEDAVRDALPGWAKDRVAVRVSGRRVTVSLRPVTVVPGTGDVLTTDAHADAGPGTTATTDSPAAGASPGLGAPDERTRDAPAGVEWTRDLPGAAEWDAAMPAGPDPERAVAADAARRAADARRRRELGR